MDEKEIFELLDIHMQYCYSDMGVCGMSIMEAILRT